MPDPSRVLLLCTFTSDLLRSAMETALGRQGCRLEVEAGPYGQVPDARVGGTDVLSDVDVVCAVVRLADLFRTDPDPDPGYRDAVPDVVARADAWAAALASQLADVRSREIPVVLAFVDHDDPSLPERSRHWCHRTARRTTESARSIGVTIVGGPPVPRDAELDALAHIPITSDATSELGERLAHAVWRLLAAPTKVFVLDCDDTLWGGACAELGPDGVDHGGPYGRLQQLVVTQRDLGRVVCLASHNHHDDVRDTLAGPGPLDAEHVTDRRVGWTPKSAMVAELAAGLDAALETVVVLDNDPVQRAEIRRMLPTVRVPEFASPDELVTIVGNLWIQGAGPTTSEDRRRADRYADEARRRSRHGPIRPDRDLIESLGVRVRARLLDADLLDRAHQMWSRISQFRIVRPGTTDPPELPLGNADPGRHAWILEVHDDIGDYGRVGLLVTRRDRSALAVDTVLLSCRVLHRGVEGCLAHLILGEARAQNAASIDLAMTRTARSEPGEVYLRRLVPDLSVDRPDELRGRVVVDGFDPSRAGPAALLAHGSDDHPSGVASSGVTT